MIYLYSIIDATCVPMCVTRKSHLHMEYSHRFTDSQLVRIWLMTTSDLNMSTVEPHSFSMDSIRFGLSYVFLVKGRIFPHIFHCEVLGVGKETVTLTTQHEAPDGTRSV
ncbi:hypothetical protein XU18_1516 [Perkinsela sp. CCAP 1560/4]|nr:hypothetical protein XU18_1516 [Perkinsela sp. CCAP 1560/4]|eukprot:KNH07884.1 hypothetical protein XU18_1516 [Perkinsela sp. CCAP 1560/4]